MSKGYLSGSPFHIVNIGDIARNSVYCNTYNPYTPPKKKQETKGHLPCLYRNSCRYGRFSYCTRKHYANFQCFFPVNVSEQTKIDIAKKFSVVSSSNNFRRLVLAYMNGKSLEFSKQEEFEEYKSRIDDLANATINYASSNTTENNNTKLKDVLIEKWSAYLLQFFDEELEIIVADSDVQMLSDLVVEDRKILPSLSRFQFAFSVERIAAERIMKLDDKYFILHDDSKKRKKRRRRRKNSK